MDGEDQEYQETRRLWEATFIHIKDQAVAEWATRTGRPVRTPEQYQAAWDAVVEERMERYHGAV